MTDYAPLWLSLRVAGCATVLCVLAGLPLAYLLARGRFAGRELLGGLVNVPLVLPPTVLGYALLIGLGVRSPLGRLWERVTGGTLVFTWQGATVAAAVAALPLFVAYARVALAAIDPDIVGAARTDGAGRRDLLRHVLLPLARPGLTAGIALAFARALGEFGATLMVAGDTPGQTQTLPLALYDAVFTGDARTAGMLSLLSALVCVGVCALAARLSPPHS